jgi:hypothetical protein
MGLGEAAERFVAESAAFGYETVATGPNRFRLARAVRPRWATVAACCLAVFLGFGLLFLLIRRTESCEAVVTDGRSGVIIRLIGPVDHAFVDRCRGVFDPSGSAAGAAAIEPIVSPPRTPNAPPRPPVVGPPGGAPFGDQMIVRHPGSPVVEPHQWASPLAPALGDHGGDTVVRPSAPALGGRDDTVVRPQQRLVSWTLVLDDGRRFDVGAGAIVGRSPAADPRRPGHALVAVDDLSLSKSHVAFVAVDDGLFAEDLHSTNGTAILAGAVRSVCQPAVRVRVFDGSVVEAGDRRLTVAVRR